MESVNTQPGLFARLKQHHIYRVAVGYGTAIAVLIQIVARAFPYLGWSAAVPVVVIILIAGFPVAIVLTWLLVKPTDPTQQTVWQKRHWKLGAIVIPVVIAAVVISGIYAFKFNERHEARIVAQQVAEQVAAQAKPTAPAAVPVIPAKSIAVLPFDNLNVDKKDAYFVVGMQDLILAKLADIGDLKVISRTSTESYGSHPENLTTVGQQLGVATLLEGSVQKAGNQVLITVQLIDAKTDAHIWAQSYQRTLDNIFGVEGEVASKVADALNAKLTAAETQAVARVPTRNPQAYDDYLRGNYFDHEAGNGDWTTLLPQAIAAYEKAVAEDPGFALAWAGLANARLDAFYWKGVRSKDILPAVEIAAKRALALDPKLPEAHLDMGEVERFLYHDIVAARDQAQQAVDLRPNDTDALQELGIEDENLGDLNGYKFMERAAVLEPTDSFHEFQLGLDRAFRGDYAGARRAAMRALGIDPQSALAYALLSRVDVLQNGDVKAASKVLDNMAPGTPSNASVANARIDLLLYRRDFAAARALATKYADEFGNDPAAFTMAMSRANVEWLAGNKDAARAFYRTAIRLLTKPANGLDVNGNMRLGLAYARLGQAGAALKQNEMAAAMDRRSHGMGFEGQRKFMLAKIRVALGDHSAAIDILSQLLARNTDGYDVSPALLRIDPTWDPIRKDPHFQALLKKYASAPPAPEASSGG